MLSPLEKLVNSVTVQMFEQKNSTQGILIRRNWNKQNVPIERKQIQRWSQSMQILLYEQYAQLEISDLRMIVIGSNGVDGFNCRTAMAAESGFYKGRNIPNSVEKLINAINLSHGLSANRNYDYSCQAAKRHTLFINVCLSNDPQHSWINAICTTQFVNQLLLLSEHNKNPLVVFDFRDRMHIHKDQLNFAQKQQSGDYQIDDLFKINTELCYRFLSKEIIDDTGEFCQELFKLSEKGYKIESLYSPDCSNDVAEQRLKTTSYQAQQFNFPNTNFFNSTPRQGLNLTRLSANQRYMESVWKSKHIRKRNLRKCHVLFSKFFDERLENYRAERKSLTLFLLLIYSLKLSWTSRQIGLKDKEKFVSFLENNPNFVQSKFDPFLFITRKCNLKILISSDQKENSALIFANDELKIKTFLYENLFMSSQGMDLSIGPINAFQGIRIDFEQSKKCFYLNQKKKIKRLIKKYGIPTIDKDGKPIYQAQPITGKMDNLDWKDFNRTHKPVAKLLDDLVEISRETRSDICGAVKKLQNYVHKPSESLWKRATEIALYLYCTREDKLKVLPMSDLAVYSDGSSNSAPVSKSSSTTELREMDAIEDCGVSLCGLFSENNSNSNSEIEIKVEEEPETKESETEVPDSKEPKPKTIKLKPQNYEHSDADPVKLSQTGHMIRCLSFPIHWISELQDIKGVADYKTHSIELIGAACAAAEVYLVKQLLSELGINYQERIQLFTDSKIVLNSINRMKDDFDQEHFWNDPNTDQEQFANCKEHLHTLLYLYVSNHIDIDYIRSGNNDADLFTKVSDKNFKVIRCKLNFVATSIDH